MKGRALLRVCCTSLSSNWCMSTVPFCPSWVHTPGSASYCWVWLQPRMMKSLRSGIFLTPFSLMISVFWWSFGLWIWLGLMSLFLVVNSWGECSGLFFRTAPTIVSFLLQSSCPSLYEVKKVISCDVASTESLCHNNSYSLVPLRDTSIWLPCINFQVRYIWSCRITGCPDLDFVFCGFRWYCLKGQQPLNGTTCSSTVTWTPGL